MSVVNVSVAGRVATLSVDRPKALNALNEEVLLELRKALIQLNDIRVLMITGAGDKAFVAGADIAAMKEMDAMKARAFVELGQGVMQLIEESPFITIAAVNGFALGGGLELALACDLIYASDSAVLGLPETNLGIIPGFGGTVNLIKRVGFHKSMEMILTGSKISAAEAKNLGLVLDVFPKNDLLTKVNAVAEQLSKKGVLSLLAARRLLRSMVGFDRERAYLLERESFASLFATTEPKEGMAAFLEKREPRFP